MWCRASGRASAALGEHRHICKGWQDTARKFEHIIDGSFGHSTDEASRPVCQTGEQFYAIEWSCSQKVTSSVLQCAILLVAQKLASMYRPEDSARELAQPCSAQSQCHSKEMRVQMLVESAPKCLHFGNIWQEAIHSPSHGPPWASYTSRASGELKSSSSLTLDCVFLGLKTISSFHIWCSMTYCLWQF